MNQFDTEMKDVINSIFSVWNYAQLGYRVSKLNSCNNCKKRDCKYKPSWGDPVRLNCPLWKGEEDE